MPPASVSTVNAGGSPSTCVYCAILLMASTHVLTSRCEDEYLTVREDASLAVVIARSIASLNVTTEALVAGIPGTGEGAWHGAT
jgi:hypothetical protein